MSAYRTVEQDRLDRICLSVYGRTDHAIEAVLAANPGLAQYGPWLPAGVQIELPELPTTQLPTQQIRLWD